MTYNHEKQRHLHTKEERSHNIVIVKGEILTGNCTNSKYR